MKITAQPKAAPKPPPGHRLRDDPAFQGHYNAILSGLYSTFPTITLGDVDYESPEAAFKALSEKLEYYTVVAYQGACHAHCYAERAEPYSDAEVAAFNAAIDAGKNGWEVEPFQNLVDLNNEPGI